MNFYKNETIAYPFTAYYFGYQADLGADPQLYVNLYSFADNRLVGVDTFVEVREVVQVANETLFVGTAYLNKLHNDLLAGEYRLKLSVQTPSQVIDLLYAPITILDHQSPFAVSFAGRERLTPEQLNYHLRDVIDPGVKSGFDVVVGATSWMFDIYPGVLFTRHGVKIEHGRISHNAVHIPPAGALSRVDVVCVHYNQDHVDEQQSPHPPEFRIIPGIEDGLNVPPSIPPHFERIAYALVPANTQSPLHIVLSKPRLIESRRPFFNVMAFTTGDGVNARFEFPTEYIPGTTTADVDGVLQYPGEDYVEVPNTLGRGTISFIGEVPQAGQRVSLSGQALIGPYFEHDYTLYSPPYALTPSVLPPYTRTGLVAEFLAANLAGSHWPNTAATSPMFQQLDPQLTPALGWDGLNGNYVSFDGNRYLTMDNDAALQLSEFTLVIKGDFRDAPQNLNWCRILTKKAGADYSLALMAVNKPVDPELHLYSMNGHLTLLPGYLWRDGPSKIIITRTSAGALKLDCNGVYSTGSSSGIGYLTDPWYLGTEDGVGSGSRLEAKLMTVLFYNRILTQPELDAI